MKMEFHSSNGTLAYNVEGFVVEFVPAARGHILLTWFNSYYTISGLQNVSSLLPEWRWPTSPEMVCVFTHVFWLLWLNHRPYRSGSKLRPGLSESFTPSDVCFHWCCLTLSTAPEISRQGRQVPSPCPVKEQPTPPSWGVSVCTTSCKCFIINIDDNGSAEKMSVLEGSLWSCSQLPCFVQERTTARCGLPQGHLAS